MNAQSTSPIKLITCSNSCHYGLFSGIGLRRRLTHNLRPSPEYGRMHARMSRIANARGATLGLVAALAFVLILIALALFSLSMLLGGSRETRNAVDAGALNVGKQALGVTVGPSSSDEQQFLDVADSSGNFGLKNINRVWGQALLAQINATAMQADAPSSQALTDAGNLQVAAQDISTRLSQQLNQPSNLYSYFTDIAEPNSVRMLGTKSHVDVVADGAWQTSLMDRGAESNLAVLADELPANFDPSTLGLTPPAKDGNVYLPGYSQVQVGGQDFWFVPFKNGEKTHLVSNTHFDSNTQTNSPINWGDAVPNSFCVHGFAGQGGDPSQQSLSYVMSHPQLYFKMQIPQAFIRITLQANTLQWNVDGIPMDTESYGFMPDVSTSYPYPLPCGSISGTEYVGNEYITGPTLFTGLFAMPPIPPGGSKAFNYLLQRAQEIIPGYKSSDLIALLVATPISTAANDQTFIIYPSSTDSSATLLISTDSAAPSWTTTQPDGTDFVLETEGPLGPNQGLTDLVCYGDWEYPSVSTFNGERHWQAGSGYQGCLGTMTIHRTTTAYLIGFCSCP
jgi:hypothetical protein